MRRSPFLIALACGACLLAPGPATRAADHVNPPSFGKTKEGISVHIYTLTNRNGCEARITNYGGIVVSLKVPDRDGHLDDVVLGHDSLEGYQEHPQPYFGALIGRYGNRIAKGKFALDGQEYSLALNNAPNTLHGGKQGFDKRVWDAKEVAAADGPSLELTYVSADGEEGYPGKLSVKAVYTLTNDDELRLAFEATTDKPTIVNLTNHSYFDLRGQGAKGDVLDHEATLFASKFVPVDGTSIPLGELRAVAGTPFDFTKPAAIGARLNDSYEQLHLGPGGYDHTYVLDGYDPKQGSVQKPFLAARVHDPASGRTVELWTAEPGVQFYTGNYLDGTFTGKKGKQYGKHAAFCLEPQHYPNSPNHPEWPSVVLRPGKLTGTRSRTNSARSREGRWMRSANPNDLQIRNSLEVPINGRERHVPLQGKCGNPEIVDGNHLAQPSQIRSDLRVWTKRVKSWINNGRASHDGLHFVQLLGRIRRTFHANQQFSHRCKWNQCAGRNHQFSSDQKNHRAGVQHVRLGK